MSDIHAARSATAPPKFPTSNRCSQGTGGSRPHHCSALSTRRGRAVPVPAAAPSTTRSAASRLPTRAAAHVRPEPSHDPDDRPTPAGIHTNPQALDRRPPIARPLPPELLEQLGADPHAPPNPDPVEPYEQPHDPPAPDLAEDLGDSRPTEASRP